MGYANSRHAGRGGRGREDPSRIREGTVDTLNDDGRGVARIEGKVTFIAGALPGERVRIHLEQCKKTYDSARVLKVLQASVNRILPECRYFGVCGGCSLQHLEPRVQISEKETIVRHKFLEFGGLLPEQWMDPLTGPLWHYRRSARLGVRDVPKKGGIIVGFRERGSAFITPLEDCLILDRRISSLLPALAELIEGLSCKRRVPQIEVACGDDEAALVFRHLEPLSANDMTHLAEFGREHQVRLYLQSAGPDSVVPLCPESPPLMSYRLPDFDVTIRFRPTDFIQINGEVNRLAVRRAVDLLEPGPDDRVLDLFCGLGNFTLPLARHAGHVTGVEAARELVERARANAEDNAVLNAEFQRVDLYDEVQVKALLQGADFNKLMLDPPRTGAIEALKQLSPKRLPGRIVYVSCNAATLARDSEYLVKVRGYRLARAGIMDMFPHTSHVESIAVFDR